MMIDAGLLRRLTPTVVPSFLELAFTLIVCGNNRSFPAVLKEVTDQVRWTQESDLLTFPNNQSGHSPENDRQVAACLERVLSSIINIEIEGAETVINRLSVNQMMEEAGHTVDASIIETIEQYVGGIRREKSVNANRGMVKILETIRTIMAAHSGTPIPRAFAGAQG